MKVRIATAHDLEAIAAVFLAASGAGSGSLEDAIAKKRSQFFETSGRDLFVALDERKGTVGYAGVLRQAQDLPLKPSELVEICVASQSQGQGVGKALLAQIRETNQCDTWTRCQRNDAQAVAWFMKQGYQYKRTEFSEAGMMTVLMRPGRISHRSAVPGDLPAMHDLFVEAVFRNSNIQHGTGLPDDFLQTVTSRVFPSADTGFSSVASVYLDDQTRLAGFHVVHCPTSKPREVELNMFCSNADLGAKDLGNYMLQRVIEQHGSEAAIMVRTWLVNKRAMAFYIKNGFEEVSREDPAETANEGRPAKITLVRPGPPSISQSESLLADSNPSPCFSEKIGKVALDI